MASTVSAPTAEWEVFIDGTLAGWSRSISPLQVLVSFWGVVELIALAKRGPVTVRLVRGEDPRSAMTLVMEFPLPGSIS